MDHKVSVITYLTVLYLNVSNGNILMTLIETNSVEVRTGWTHLNLFPLDSIEIAFLEGLKL